jgi:hypothetical protein
LIDPILSPFPEQHGHAQKNGRFHMLSKQTIYSFLIVSAVKAKKKKQKGKGRDESGGAKKSDFNII